MLTANQLDAFVTQTALCKIADRTVPLEALLQERKLRQAAEREAKSLRDEAAKGITAHSIFALVRELGELRDEMRELIREIRELEFDGEGDNK